MSANDKQVGGEHYQQPEGVPQPWDIAAQYQLDFFEGNVVTYVLRWRKKGGLQDLEKAAHYLEKYIELIKGGIVEDPTNRPKQNPEKLDLDLDDNGNRVSIKSQYITRYHISPHSNEDYSYEGGKVDRELYRCKRCGEHFETPLYGDPYLYHSHQPDYVAGDGNIS